MVFRPGILDDLARKRGDDGQDQNGLRDHHRRRRKQEPQLAERPRAGQQEIDQQSHDHGRQPHQGIEHDDQRLAPVEAAHSYRRPQGQPRHARDRHRA